MCQLPRDQDTQSSMNRHAHNDYLYLVADEREPTTHGFLDNSVLNFFALFSLELISVYVNGRLKARSARGMYLDLQCLKDIERDTFLPDPKGWIPIIKNLDAQS